jgi:hypothetical protein
MSWPILRKELREHGAILLIAWLVSAPVFWSLLSRSASSGGRFEGLVMFVLVMGTLLALILSNRLFAREYAGRTQLFLEILPVSRARVFATKWLLGCALFLATLATGWWLTLLWIRRNETLSLEAALPTLGSLSLYCFILWAFAALAGMLGRYRYLAWLFVLIAFSGAASVTGLEVQQLPIARLLGDDIMMARTELTARDVLVPLAAAGVCILTAAALALTGSGAIASMLAQRMTARERAFVIISILAVLTVLSTLEPKPVKPLFALTNGERIEGSNAAVAVLPTGDFDASAGNELASAIAQDVDTLVSALALRTKTSIAVLPQQGLDPHVMQRARLAASDGIVLKVAPDAPRESVRALVLHSLLLDYTLDRAHREDRHVLLDGLAAYWPMQDEPATRARWWLRAAAAPGPLGAADLRQWSRTSEQLGDCLSQAVAFGAMDVMAAELGRERMLQLMQRIFRRPADDARVLFERGPAELLADAGLPWPVLAAKLEAVRKRVRSARASELAQRRAVDAEVAWRQDVRRGLTIETTVKGIDAYRVLYRQLGPWTADVGELARLDVRSERAVLPISPVRGARVLAAIEFDDELLGCPVRALARRVRLQ